MPVKEDPGPSQGQTAKVENRNDTASGLKIHPAGEGREKAMFAGRIWKVEGCEFDEISSEDTGGWQKSPGSGVVHLWF